MNETSQHTYETATARIEEIIRRLDSGELDAVGQGLEELRLDELVARLEQRPAEAS